MNYTPDEIAELLKERPNQPHYIAGLIRKAVAAEREACARVCEERGMVKGGEVFSARIRARSQA